MARAANERELPEAQRLLTAAMTTEGEAQRALLAGEGELARQRFREASELYRRSWEAAPPRAFGRLIGMLKAALLAGGGAEVAAYVREAIADPDSPASAYAIALAALVEGDDERAAKATGPMPEGGDAFARTALAISALAERDRDRYRRALGEIIADFEGRSNHLTGVAVADTALVLEELAERRGLAVHPSSSVLPADDA